MLTFLRSLLTPPKDRAAGPSRTCLPSADTPEKRASISATVLALQSGRQLIQFGDHDRGAFDSFHEDFRFHPAELAAPVAAAMFASHAELAPAYLVHSNGYVRHAAIEALRAEDLTALPLLWLCARTNDWVDPVRFAALDRLERVLPGLPHHVLVSALPVLIRRTPSWRRWRVVHGVALNAPEPDLLDRLLAVEMAQRAAIDMLMTVRSGPTTRMLQTLAKHAWLDAHLESLARKAAAVGIRRAATRALLTGEIRWTQGHRTVRSPIGERRVPVVERRPLTVTPQRARLFAETARDRSALLRALAADALIAEGPDAFTREDWEHLTGDHRPTVRSRMDFFRRKWLDDDLPDYLRR